MLAHHTNRLARSHPTRAGVYAYNVSVAGGSSCTTSLNVTACHVATVTCAAARVLALPQDGRCATFALAQSSIYNVTSSGGVPPVATVVPTLPSPLSFAPGGLIPHACPGQAVATQIAGAVGLGALPICNVQTGEACICGNGVCGNAVRPCCILQGVCRRHPGRRRFSLSHSAARMSRTLGPPPPLRAGVYAYNVSVPGRSSCVASFNVTVCPPATVACAPARVVAQTPATSCNHAVLPVSSFYTVTAPGDVPAVVTVNPPLPGSLTFGPGEPGLHACQGGPSEAPQRGNFAGDGQRSETSCANLAHSARP